jgi:hypothetical protein
MPPLDADATSNDTLKLTPSTGGLVPVVVAGVVGARAAAGARAGVDVPARAAARARLVPVFVLARVLNRMDGGDDVYWKSERLKNAS